MCWTRKGFGWSRPRQNYLRPTAGWDHASVGVGRSVVAFRNYEDERRTEIDMRSCGVALPRNVLFDLICHPVPLELPIHEFITN